MDIGERIQLSEEEREALKFGDLPLSQDWPVTRDGFRELEHLIFERIVDKRGVLEEMRRESKLRHAPEEAFRLRRHLGVLYEAHDQLFAFAVERDFDLPGPND
jgi:hypothetical protein